MAMESTTVYFERGGAHNTDDTLQFAKQRAAALGIRDIVLASYTGETGVKAASVFKGDNLIVVAGVVGFRKPNTVSMVENHKAQIESNGGRILFSGHAFGMLGRAVHHKLGAIQMDEIIAHVLRLFSQGIKVGCEISCMAVDAGLIQSGQDVIAIGGSGTGADSAIVLSASNTHTFFETRILEIICKPR